MFFKTIPQTPQEAIRCDLMAASQDAAIMDWMARSGQEVTAWGLQDVFTGYQITSIRRTLFNLEKEGKITQTGFKPGPHRVKVGTFKIAEKAEVKQGNLW